MHSQQLMLLTLSHPVSPTSRDPPGQTHTSPKRGFVQGSRYWGYSNFWDVFASPKFKEHLNVRGKVLNLIEVNIYQR